MGISQTIKNYLEKEKVSYQSLEHDLAYTALETAEAQHVPGRQVVKSVIVSADGKNVMCVLPSIYKIDMEKLKSALKAKEVHLANEKQVATLFPGYELGAEPPFGSQAGLKVFLENVLKENDSIVFNAGTHTDMIRIKMKDYIRLANPTFADFATHMTH